MSFNDVMPLQAPETPSQFLAWAKDVPYLATYTPHGAGFFDRIEFKVADPDFKNTLADDARELFVHPDDIREKGSPIKFLEGVLEQAA